MILILPWNESLHQTRHETFNRWLRHQQQELSVAVASGRVRSLSDQQAIELLGAAEAAAGMWAAAIALEAKRKTCDLRIIRRVTLTKTIYGRMKPNGPAVQALTALAQYKPVTPVSTNLLPTRTRDQLRGTLARTPLGERPPHLKKPTAGARRPGLGR